MRTLLNAAGVVAAIGFAVMFIACSGAGGDIGTPKPQNRITSLPTRPNAPLGPNDAGPAEGPYSFDTTPTQSNASYAPLMLEDWHFTKEFGYVQAEGRVTNTTSSPMANVEVVVEYFTADGTFVKSSEAMIAYNPVLSGQTSPFTTITTGNPEIARGSVTFKEMFRGTIAHSSRAKEEAQARLELAATEVRLDSVRKQHATEEAALKLEELCKQSPVAWETLKQELGDSLSPAKRDLLKAFIKEYEGTPEGELANKESRAEGLWTLVQQYDRLKSKEKSLELANELIEQYPETIAGRLARRMIDERK